eukprot:TRINITY_DN3788_c0_g2_i1.p1 TRINITY_DN3788_c0_g2~~TRINITY_DN3788_c0_g2_i1.p1  ORF type:complete len:1605 (+),score=191.21 TRINITY_DN3788_c0_g2_i1:33-4847(+)
MHLRIADCVLVVVCCCWVLVVGVVDGAPPSTKTGIALARGLGTPTAKNLVSQLTAYYSFDSDYLSASYTPVYNLSVLLDTLLEPQGQFLNYQEQNPDYLFFVVDNFFVGSVLPQGLLCIPFAAYAVIFPYRLDGVDGQVVLSMQVLGAILLGDITNWNHTALAQLNPTLSLPDLTIRLVLYNTPVAANYLVSTALSQVIDNWSELVAATGINVKYPAENTRTLYGSIDNPGAWLTKLQSTDGTLGYALYSDLLGLDYSDCAMNRNTKIVTASTDTVTLAMQSFAPEINSQIYYTGSLVNPTDVNAWPICGIVNVGVALSIELDCDTESLVLSMLTWMNANDASRNTMLLNGFVPQTIGIRTHALDRASQYTCIDNEYVYKDVILSAYGPSAVSPIWQAWARVYSLDVGSNIFVDYTEVELDEIAPGLLARDVKFVTLLSPLDSDVLDEEGGEDILQIPVFALGMSIVYNIPEIYPNLTSATVTPPLNVTAQILANIYMGTITTWDHEDIVKANPLLSDRLPNEPIIVLLYNSEQFYTQLLIDGINSLDPNYHIPLDTNWTSIDPERIITTSVDSAIMVLQQTPYSIGHLSHSVFITQGRDSVQEALVINRRGNAVGPTPANVLSAVQDWGTTVFSSQSASKRDPNTLPGSLTGGLGNQSYPFSSFKYVAFHTTGQEVNCRALVQLLDFIVWCQSYSTAFSLLDKFGATNLTAELQRQVLETLATVECNNTFALDIHGCLSDGTICSDNGKCYNGACLCQSGFSGQYCTPTDDGESQDLSIIYTIVLSVGLPLACLCCILFVIIVILIIIWKRPTDRPWAVDFSEIELKQRIGAGGYGEVHKAIWKDNDVAVKLLAAGTSISRENKAAFVSEVKIMTQLRHPNVVLFMGACTTPPNLCIIMEYMELGSLYDVLHNELVPRLPMTLKIKLAMQAAQGMHFLHSSGILHRDLKSPNILLDDNWNAKISDFGLTKLKEQDSGSNMDKLAGSLLWTAPEILGETASFSEASDVYSFGIVLWELLTAEDPYGGLNPTTVAVCVLRDNLRPVMPRDVQPIEYASLVVACWDNHMDARPTFLEAVTRLKALAFSTSSSGGEGEYSATSRSRLQKDSTTTGGSSSVYDEGETATTSNSLDGNAKRLAVIDRAVHAPTGEVVLIMTDIYQAGALWEFNAEVMKQATIQHNHIIRTSLQELKGYEVHLQRERVCLSGEGSFCIAFQHVNDAVQWAATVQERLISAEWDAVLLAHPAAAEEWAGEDDQVIYKGLRVQMGMHLGTAQIARDPMTRRIEYTGPLVHKTGKLASLAHGGQILATRPVYKAMNHDKTAVVAAVSVGTMSFASEPAIPVYELKPHKLAGRFFGEMSGRLKEHGHKSKKLDKDKYSSNNNIRPFASLSINHSLSGSDQSALEMEVMADHPDGTQTSAVQLNSANLCRWVIDWNDLKLGKQVGIGSYGVVYHARWRGVDVAVKRFVKQKLSERHMLDFRAEVAFLSEMHHPNIVLFIGACMQSPNLCIVTEYVKQGSLRDVLANKSNKLSWQLRMRIAKTAALGVYYLHSLEPVIMHRDLKSSNILVDENWNAKVADFGFARIKQDNATMTRCGSPCWTGMFG